MNPPRNQRPARLRPPRLLSFGLLAMGLSACSAVPPTAAVRAQSPQRSKVEGPEAGDQATSQPWTQNPRASESRSPRPRVTPTGFKPRPLEAETTISSPPQDEPAALTLDEVEHMALENNPTLRQLEAAVDKARGVREQVGLLPNPTIGYFGEEMGADGTAGKQGGFVSQTIVTGDKLRLNRAVAGHDVQALLWERDAQRYRVLTDVRSQFYELLGAMRRVDVSQQLVRVANEGVTVAQELFRAEQGARPDVLQAQVQLNEVRIILQNAEADLQASRRRLAALVGRPQLDTDNITGTLDADLPERPWEPTYEELLTASPELQAALTRVNRARAQIRRQEAQPIPNLLAQVVVTHDNVDSEELANVQLGVPLPVFNRNQGNIDIALADYRRALDEVERLQLALRSRLAEALAAYRKARQQVERYRQNILPQARENLELTEDGYKLGEFDFLRVLTARRTFFETNLAYIRALIDQRQAGAVIDGLLLSGGLSEVMDLRSGLLGGPGQRGRALSGQ